MRLKTFYAKTMTEAMQLVRDTLGEDAIIVATREEQGGRRVRVTAAIDEAMEPASKNINFEFGSYLKQAASTPINRDAPHHSGATAKPVMNKTPEWLAYDDEEQDGGVAEYLSEVLLRHAVPNEVMDSIVTAAMLVGGEDPRRVLVQSLGSLFSFTTDLGADRPVMLVGAPGAGKTLAAAKIAASAALTGQKTAVITTDVVRAGAREQLEAFMRILGITLQAAKTPKELAQEVARAQQSGAQKIVIDTGGTNPFDPEEMRDLSKFLQAVPVDAALVLPAGVDADESAEMARVYALLGVNTLIPTRLDIARRIGGILGAAHKGGMNFAIGSTSAGVADGLLSLSPGAIANILMPQKQKEKSTRGMS